MGYYIETPGKNFGKADELVEKYDAIIIPAPKTFAEIPAEYGLICVIRNPFFEAAAYCFNEREFEAFNEPSDFRPRVWVLMDKEKAETLSGFVNKNKER